MPADVMPEGTHQAALPIASGEDRRFLRLRTRLASKGTPSQTAVVHAAPRGVFFCHICVQQSLSPYLNQFTFKI